jgi:hypothetical protein
VACFKVLVSVPTSSFIRLLALPALEVRGTEADICNAAYRAGFDTNNHPALFDLIWAVKKQVIGKLPQRLPIRPPPKPYHPIYPDRYRPSGIGDNTAPSKKRKRLVSNEVPKFHPVKPLGGKKKAGTKQNPINLDSDGEGDSIQEPKAANSSAKRRKVSDNGRSVVGAVPSNNVVMELLEVKNRLATARRDMVSCSVSMLLQRFAFTRPR